VKRFLPVPMATQSMAPTDYHLNTGIVGSNLAWGTASRTALGPTQSPIQWVQGVKRPGREADHSSPSSVKVRDAWSYTSTPQYVFMAWCLVKQDRRPISRLESKLRGLKGRTQRPFCLCESDTPVVDYLRDMPSPKLLYLIRRTASSGADWGYRKTESLSITVKRFYSHLIWISSGYHTFLVVFLSPPGIFWYST
jgi:hypothetical protein